MSFVTRTNPKYSCRKKLLNQPQSFFTSSTFFAFSPWESHNVFALNPDHLVQRHFTKYKSIVLISIIIPWRELWVISKATVEVVSWCNKQIASENIKPWFTLPHLFPMHPFSTPWKSKKTLRFSDVFRGDRKGALGTNGLRKQGLTETIFPMFYVII